MNFLGQFFFTGSVFVELKQNYCKYQDRNAVQICVFSTHFGAMEYEYYKRSADTVTQPSKKQIALKQ